MKKTEVCEAEPKFSRDDIDALVRFVACDADVFVIRECRTQSFWGPNHGGYTDLVRAGLYSRAEAMRVQAFSERYGRADKAMPLAEAVADVYGEPRPETFYDALMRALAVEKKTESKLVRGALDAQDAAERRYFEAKGRLDELQRKLANGGGDLAAG